MDNAKVKTYLNYKGIDTSVPFFDEGDLEDVDANSGYKSTGFDHKRFRENMTGARDSLVVRNCLFDDMSILRVSVKQKIVFHNCIFRNVKFQKCTFKKATFYNCMFVETSFVGSALQGSYLVNCRGIDSTYFSECHLEECIFIGALMNSELLAGDGNLVDKIESYEKWYEDSDNVATLPRGEEEKEVARNIVENQKFDDKLFGKEDLDNALYHKCQFISCTFDKDVNLGANLDFKSCTFKRTSIQCADIKKTSFDDCIFEDLKFAGNYLHVSFAGSSFKNIIIDEGASFVACQFDHTNAREYFDVAKNNMFNIMLEKEMKPAVNTELQHALDVLYEVLKNDKQDEQTVSLESLSQEDIAKFIANLSDRDYISLITSAGAMRKENEDYA